MVPSIIQEVTDMRKYFMRGRKTTRVKDGEQKKRHLAKQSLEGLKV